MRNLPMFSMIISELKVVMNLNSSSQQSKYGRGNETFSISRNFDSSTLSSCTDTIEEHLNHINFQVGTWKGADIAKPDMP